ncbi:hypothetical protein ACH5RR_001542 [Cinchona calisaya]|uniref:Uncharacterized protein n=1 Tax=Cinchona calisaya TaxID=153742 RepID=A0ABD3B4B9_9GENT
MDVTLLASKIFNSAYLYIVQKSVTELYAYGLASLHSSNLSVLATSRDNGLGSATKLSGSLASRVGGRVVPLCNVALPVAFTEFTHMIRFFFTPFDNTTWQ